MALFQRKKKEPAVATDVVPESKKTEKKAVKSAAPLHGVSFAGDLSHILKNPRITEKATAHGELGVYTFDVAPVATKRTVRSAIAALYKVSPRKIRIVPVPSKVRRSAKTGTRGISRGGKKAYVYLKKGDAITIS